MVEATASNPDKSGFESPHRYQFEPELAAEIRRRIDANEDVTVRNGMVSGVPCTFSYGYGKSR